MVSPNLCRDPSPLPVQTFEIHYQNPLLYDNFPDPGVMKVGTRFYAFATNGAGGNVQAATSRDLVRGRTLVR